MFATTRRTIEQARRERRSGNPAEVALWRVLKTRPGGRKFRRQHPIGTYILDFCCLSARLAIEVDGQAHDAPGRIARDDIRERWLADRGFCTIRIPARDVLTDVEPVVRLILAACQARPLHRPAAGPPPRSGEVLEEAL